MKVISLKHKKSLIIYPKSPYNFDATVFKPAHYPDPLKIYETGKYWFALRSDKSIYGIKLVNKGTVIKPKIRVIIFSKTRLSKEKIKKIIDEISYRFEFNRDISEFYKKFKNDKVLSLFFHKWSGLRGS